MLAVFLLLMVALVKATLYVGFPLSEQLPNVARVDQDYNFQMANVTFKSTGGTVSYLASNLPSWMSFDSSSRSFTGKPSSSDVTSSTTIVLTGVDSADNSTISRNYTFMVSLQPGLELSSTDVMFTEIANYGETNGDDGLVVKPGEKFDIKFGKSVFVKKSGESNDIVAYYGRSSDRTSLPNWISFNEDDLSFSGTVPYVTSSIAPSMIYGFSLIATDFSGYTGAEGIFQLIVGAHQLSTSLNETIKINGTENSDFEVTIPILSSVYLDGTLISKANISSVTSEDIPDFVSLNVDNYTLTGTFPSETTYDNFTVLILDTYGNKVQLPYLIDSFGSSFTILSLPDVNATKGEYFNYQLMNSYFTENNTNVTVEYSDANWLLYHQTNKTLNGQVPNNFDSLDIRVRAVSDFNDDSKDFQIKGVSKALTTSLLTSSSSSTATSSSTSSASGSNSSTSSSTDTSSSTLHKKGISNTKALAIGLGVGIPLFFIAIAALLLICCCLRKRKRRTSPKSDDDDEKIVPVKGQKKHRTDPEIDGPGFGTHYANTTTNSGHDNANDLKQLSAMNIRQMDQKKKDNNSDDARSTSSSLTHVESDVSSDYFDAPERPIKSWRANDTSDAAYGRLITTKDNRVSATSMSTVNTENLFSVRLVEDGSNRNSNQSSGISNKFLSGNSLNNILKRDSSGNIQRLDSDGNIVENNVLPKMDRSRSTNSNLAGILEEKSRDGIVEERSRDLTQSTEYHSMGTIQREDSSYNNLPLGREDSSYNNLPRDDSYNLLSKFDKSGISSASTSDQQISSRYGGSEGSFDDFQVVPGQNGEVRWSASQNNSVDVIKRNEYSSKQGSLDMFSDGESRPKTESRNSLTSFGGNAKLVDFTRKGSLKDAEYKHNNFAGETADILEDESDLDRLSNDRESN